MSTVGCTDPRHAVLAVCVFVGGLTASGLAAAQEHGEDSTPESVCPVDPVAEAAAEERARGQDRGRDAVDVTKRTIDDAFDRADRYWQRQNDAFHKAFSARVSEVAVSVEEGERAVARGSPEEDRSRVNSETCRTLAARELSVCDAIPEPSQRQACFVLTMALSMSYGVEDPDDAFCAALFACPGACCRLLYRGDASGCDAAEGLERRACQRVRQTRDAWRERCGEGGRGLECIGALIFLAHQHGPSVCEWPIAAHGEDERTTHLRDVCQAALRGEPERCGGPSERRGKVPYRYAVDSRLMASSGVTWWVVAAMASVPSVCHLRGHVVEGDRAPEAVSATLTSLGVALPMSRRVRLRGGSNATRARIESESACVPTVSWP